MANLANIARPYALAAFETARDQQQLPAWKAFLEAAAITANNPVVATLLKNPQTSTELVFGLFSEVLQTLTGTEQKNFLSLLSQNHRLIVLPEIAEQFNVYYAALEKMRAVRVVSAIALSPEFEQTLINALSKRIKSNVTLKSEVDPSILGGAIIHMGDNVIDGSVRGKLTRMLQNLTS